MLPELDNKVHPLQMIEQLRQNKLDRVVTRFKKVSVYLSVLFNWDDTTSLQLKVLHLDFYLNVLFLLWRIAHVSVYYNFGSSLWMH